MANDLAGNPYKVDTAVVVTTASVKVLQMVWQEPSAAGQDLIILDSNGRTLWDENSLFGGTGVSIEQDLNIMCNGLNVSVIDSGTLYIYIE